MYVVKRAGVLKSCVYVKQTSFIIWRLMRVMSNMTKRAR
jgi:hypothetical protein